MDQSTNYTHWRTIALFMLTACCVIACILFAHRLMFPLIGGVTLAVVMQPVAAWLRTRYSSTLAATLMVVLVCVVLFAPMYFLLKHLIAQAVSLVRFMQDGGLDDFWAELSDKHPKLGDTVESMVTQISPGLSGRAVAGWFAPIAGRAFGSFIRGVVDFVLLLFFYFFLVRDEDAAVRAWKSVLPLRADESRDFTQKMRDIIQAIFAGRMLIAALQGTASGIAYWLAGVPGALLWGFVTFVCCLIPAFGAFLAWVPICLYLGLTQSWTRALLLSIWCGGVVSTMDNFLYPVFVGRKTDLHTVVIFVAIFGGLAYFGISGFILGPVLVTSAILLLQIWKNRMAEAHNE